MFVYWYGPPIPQLRELKVERVAVLLPHLADHMLSLNLCPIGCVTEDDAGERFEPYLEERLTGVIGLGKAKRIDVNRLSRLQPDLILGEAKKHLAIYDQLNSIAPCVLIQDLTVPWENTLHFLAEILNREDEARVGLARLHDRVGRLRSLLPAAFMNQSFIVLNLWKRNACKLYTPYSPLGKLLYVQLGLTPPAGTPEDRPLAIVDLRDLHELDPCRIAVLGADYAFHRAVLQDLETTDEWRSLRAVREGQIRHISWLKDGEEGRSLVMYTKVLDEFEHWMQEGISR